MANMGLLYKGLEIMGEGAILSGLVLGAIAVFVIDKKFKQAAAFALAGAVLTYFGSMHGPAVGFGANGLGVTPSVALSYAVVVAFLFVVAKRAAPVAATAPIGSAHQPAE